MAQYNLIFQGKIIDGASLDEVKSNIARLFKTDAAKTAILFSGKSIVIKKNLDTESTKKYLAIIKKTGAIVSAVKVEPPVEKSATPSSQSTKGMSAGLASLVNYNKNSIKNEDTDIHEETGLQLAPIGAYLVNYNKNQNNIELPDTSYLTMSEAETGSLEEYAPTIEAIELPDIENLSLSAANTGTLEEFSIKKEAVELPDISELDITKQDNIPLSSESPKQTSADLPDTSDLSMSAAREGTLEGIEIKPVNTTIPDTSHLTIEKTEEKKKISGKASFQID